MDRRDRVLTAVRPARGLRAAPADVAETGTAAATRIVVLDDHTLYREGLREILRAEGGFAVVGEAADHTRAIRAVAETQPDVALLDAGLCGFADDDVASTVRAMLAEAPGTRVIVMSVPDRQYTIQALLAAGVRGYLLKSATRYELIAAMHAVMSDDQRVVLSVTVTTLTQIHAPSRPSYLLSAREREVISLVAQGLTNGQAAHQLRIAEGTVKHHLRNIFAKLGATCRVDAVNKAIALSLVEPPRIARHDTAGGRP